MSSPNSQRHPVIALLAKSLEYLLILAMAILVVNVIWGVLARMLVTAGVLERQSNWTEELARFLMIWVGLLGASLAFEKKAHLGVDFFVGKFHPTAQKILQIGTLLVVLCFAVGVLCIGGWELVSRTLALKQETPALGIQKGWVYLAVPISGFFTVIFTLVQMVDVIRSEARSVHDVPEEKEVL
jgi:TRAP-type C4-dicarboxylate transport system permease small subunit